MESILILGLIFLVVGLVLSQNKKIGQWNTLSAILVGVGVGLILVWLLLHFERKDITTKPQPHADIIKSIEVQYDTINHYRTTYIKGKSIHDTLIKHIHDTIRPECLPAFNICDSIRLNERKKADSLIQAQYKVDSLNRILIGSLQSDNVLLRDTIGDLRKPKRLKKLATRLKHFAQDVVLVGSGYVVYKMIKP